MSKRSDPLYPATTLCRPEALMRRLVETERALQLGDELRPQTLRAAIGACRAGFGGDRDVSALLRHAARCCEPCPVSSAIRSEEHTSELQSLMRISYAVFCLKKKTKKSEKQTQTNTQ